MQYTYILSTSWTCRSCKKQFTFAYCFPRYEFTRNIKDLPIYDAKKRIVNEFKPIHNIANGDNAIVRAAKINGSMQDLLLILLYK